MVHTSLWILLLTLLPMAGKAVGQVSYPEQALNALKDALNQRNPSLIDSNISPGYITGELTDETARQALWQFVRDYPEHILRIRITGRSATVNGNRLHAEFEVGRGTEGYDFVLDTAHRFMEIGMFVADAGNQYMYPAPSGLTLPDTISAAFELAGRLITISAMLDGKPGVFVLDNGAPFMILNSKRLRVPVSRRHSNGERMGGIFGDLPSGNLADVRQFQWNGYQSLNHKAAVIDLSDLERQTGRQITGMIGYSTLKDYELALDYATSSLTLTRIDRMGEPVVKRDYGTPAHQSTITLMHHVPVIGLRIGGTTYRMGLDCGAETNLLRAGLEHTLSGQYQIVDKEVVSGLGNTLDTVNRVQLAHVWLGNMDLSGIQAVFAGLNNAGGTFDTRLDGLMGYEFLSRYKTVLNIRKRTVSFYKN